MVIVQFGGRHPEHCRQRQNAYLSGHHAGNIDSDNHCSEYDGAPGIPMPEAGMASNKRWKRKTHRWLYWSVPPMCWAAGAWKLSMMKRCCSKYMAAAVDATPERPILIDKFYNAIEAAAPLPTAPMLLYLLHGILSWPVFIRGFSLRHSAHQHSLRCGNHQRVHPADCQGDGRGRFDEYPVCHRQ